MTTNVQLSFADGSAPILNAAVFYLRYDDALNEPFVLTLRLTSSDPAIVPKAVLGARVVVELWGEPWLQRIPGIVASFHQKTALSGGAVEASIYEIVVRPPLWLLSTRVARRIHQNVTAIGAVEATLAALGGIADAPKNRCGRVLPVADVVVQYDETDLHFVRRVLSEAHLVGFFDPSADHTWTLSDNVTTAAAPLPTPLVFRPPSGLVPTSPHVIALSTEDALSVRDASLRDYNFEHPQLSRAVPAGLDGQAETTPSLPHEVGQHQAFEVGRFTTDQEASAIAARELHAVRSSAHAVVCITNFALTAGSRFLLLDHPRTDLGTDFIVIASTVVVDDRSSDAGFVGGRRYEATCIPASQPHYAVPVAKPRVPASESAFVVGDGPEGTVEVDASSCPKRPGPRGARSEKSPLWGSSRGALAQATGAV